MTSIVSFTDLPAKDQFDSWSETVSQTYVPLAATAHTGGLPFGGELVSQSVGSTHISEISGSSCEVARTAQTIRQSDPGLLKLGLQLRGYCVLTQDGREAALTPGDFALYDTRRQYQLSFDDTFKCLVVMFPRELLPLRNDELGQFTARRVSGRQGIGGLVAPLLLTMSKQMRSDELSANLEVSSAVINMLAAAITEQLGVESRVPPETHRAALILRIKAFIDARLEDPELSSSRIAEAHNISSRYLQKLFESEGMTVTDWIRSRRLEHCRSDLLDPRFAGTSIGAIAARWGLIDSSYFSRLFKLAYGEAPREFRAHAQIASGAVDLKLRKPHGIASA
ncbi:helix-turn-helix domain-containing protein [Mycolicibacterium hippocampi]|uniref:AraC family transcriptional regulator n=1 Tax=Mycolicibacterium hippocampi TaxID=659824 RepID=A0A7I9ZLZ9_9MYCO|nr:helix-turn-helix domain-containing protein [Mycolicibacterium hippocampi]GFH02062.1 AraC family transcriptional regulator [Mycolicibacterium hippocampi]